MAGPQDGRQHLPDDVVVRPGERMAAALQVRHQPPLQPRGHEGVEGVAGDGRVVAHLGHAGGHAVLVPKVLVAVADDVKGGDGG